MHNKITPIRAAYPDRLGVWFLNLRELFRTDIPQILGILGFALAAFTELPDNARIAIAVGGALSLALYVASKDKNRARLANLVARRFLARTDDPHLQARLKTSADQLLDSYIQEEYPDWYFPELTQAIRRVSAGKTSGIPQESSQPES